MCNCDEGRIEKDLVTIRGRDVQVGSAPMPGVHDCEYIEFWNAYIPIAERNADSIVSDRNKAAWGLEFHRQMEKLIKKARNAL